MWLSWLRIGNSGRKFFEGLRNWLADWQFAFQKLCPMKSQTHTSTHTHTHTYIYIYTLVPLTVKWTGPYTYYVTNSTDWSLNPGRRYCISKHVRTRLWGQTTLHVDGNRGSFPGVRRKERHVNHTYGTNLPLPLTVMECDRSIHHSKFQELASINMRSSLMLQKWTRAGRDVCLSTLLLHIRNCKPQVIVRSPRRCMRVWCGAGNC